MSSVIQFPSVIQAHTKSTPNSTQVNDENNIHWIDYLLSLRQQMESKFESLDSKQQTVFNYRNFANMFRKTNSKYRH